jgi:addiction module HigA family antidote
VAAKKLRVARPTLSRLLNGCASFTAVMALRLADAFGTEPGMWLDLQQQYDLCHAAKRKRQRSRSFSRRRGISQAFESRLGVTDTAQTKKVDYTGSHVPKRGVHMRRNAAILLAFLVSFLTPRTVADIAAIHASALPQETAVLAALDDATQLEPYCRSWTNNWKYPIAKEDAATRLGKDLGFLTLALKNNPDNAELLLLTGIVAHYAYNLDLSGSYDTAIGVLGQAQKLVPTDVRAPWFRASLLCQTTQPKSGADEFLAIEGSHAWDQLPAAFWDDYMECVSVTSMPAHILRAAHYLEKLHAPASEMRTFLTNGARKRFDPFDPKKDYEPKEVWRVANAGENPEFTSTTCGLRFLAHGDWAVNQLAVTKGSCVAYFSTGPYKAATRNLRPSVLLLLKQPEGNETLQEFSKKFLTNGTFEPFAASRCPADTCIAMKGLQPGMYGRDGKGADGLLCLA